MKTVTIYTDGACSGNPGPGGCSGAQHRILPFGEDVRAADKKGSYEIPYSRQREAMKP